MVLCRAISIYDRSKQQQNCLYMVRTWFMVRMKALGALDKPWGMTNHLYQPSRVFNVVIYSSPCRILIWWQPLRRFIFEKSVAPFNISSMSSDLDMGYLYLIVILLIAWLSMHMHHAPSFLGVRRAGNAHGLILPLTKPFLIQSVILCNSSCSKGLIW